MVIVRKSKMLLFNLLVIYSSILQISNAKELTPDYSKDTKKIRRAENNELTRCMDNPTKFNLQTTRGVYSGTELWPNGKVYYKFKQEDGYRIEDEYKNKILLAMEVISNETCIRFIEDSSKTNGVISIQRKSESRGKICQSELGYFRNSLQKLILSPESCSSYYTSGAVHELMHALGFIHEFQRTDRDNYLNFHRENIRRDFSRDDIRMNFEKINELSEGLPFNFKSILQYHPTANAIPGKYVFTEVHKLTLKLTNAIAARCSNSEQLRTKILKQKTPIGDNPKPLGEFQDMGQSCLFSAGDINLVQKIYHNECGTRFRMTEKDISIPFSDCNIYFGKQSGSKNALNTPWVQTPDLKPILPTGNVI